MDIVTINGVNINILGRKIQNGIRLYFKKIEVVCKKMQKARWGWGRCGRENEIKKKKVGYQELKKICQVKNKLG